MNGKLDPQQTALPSGKVLSSKTYRGALRITAILLNVLVLVFVLWMDVESLTFARSADMSLPQSMGAIVGQWIVLGFTTIPTLTALLREQPRIEFYAMIVNLVLLGGFALTFIVLVFAMFLPGTDYKLVLIAVIPAGGFLLPIVFNVLALRQRRAARLHKLGDTAA